MYKGKFFVPSIEHQGDIDYFSSVIRDAGGDITREYWDGEEDGNAIIFYQCQSKEQLAKVERALDNA